MCTKKIIKIDSEENMFLSNSYPYGPDNSKFPCSFTVEFDGIEFDCVEKAYQAAKCSRRADRFQFQSLSAFKAKELGESTQIELRENWLQVKFRIMYELVWQKFSFCEELRQKLLATGDAEIFEPENHLGEILMRVRNAIK